MKTSEFVSLGHPDRIADYISEYLLNVYVAGDPDVRYAVECQIKGNHVSLAGEITKKCETAYLPIMVERALAEIGYTKEYCDFWGKENTINPDELVVSDYITEQSPDIACGVNKDAWGDQGIFWGCAYPTPDYLPMDYSIARKLNNCLYNLSQKEKIIGLDIKTQITVDDNNNVSKLIVAAPCKPEDKQKLFNYVADFARTNKINCESIINGTGEYIKHASVADCGTTGRKLAVDFYGGGCFIGGGAITTKDGTKADLSLNLYARTLAVNYLRKHPDVNAPIFVQIACCIGRPEIIVSIRDCHLNELESYEEVRRPSELIAYYKLNKPVFTELMRDGLAAYAIKGEI